MADQQHRDDSPLLHERAAEALILAAEPVARDRARARRARPRRGAALARREAPALPATPAPSAG
jgi:hypothetical protein